jgi:hypothetical protein
MLAPVGSLRGVLPLGLQTQDDFASWGRPSGGFRQPGAADAQLGTVEEDDALADWWVSTKAERGCVAV